MPKLTKRKPLLYEGDIILLTGPIQRYLTVTRVELMGVITKKSVRGRGKVLEVREVEDDRD